MPRRRNKLNNTTKFKLQQVVRLMAMERPPEQIAMLLGMSLGNLTELMNHKEYKQIEATYLEKLYGPLDQAIQVRGAQHLLEEAAPDAAEALMALIYDDDPSERRRASIAVLDRSGHGPIQRRAVLKRIELDPVSAKLLQQAMKDSVVDIESEVLSDD